MASTLKEVRSENIRLKKKSNDLAKLVSVQKKQLAHLDKISKMLVQKDWQILQIRDEQEDRILELDTTAKRLVRRDFELSQANEHLREVDKLKSEFVSLAAHQLRTPVSIVKWTLTMLLSGDFGKLNNEQRESINRAVDEVNGLVDLISDLLNVSRIESGRLAYNKSRIEVVSLLKKLSKSFAVSAKKKKISFKLNIPKGKKIWLVADENKLSSALGSIIENAIMYTSKGGVNVTLKDRAGEVVISIQDTGMGIPKAQIPFIFLKFFRAKNVIKKQIQGTGLGLYLAKNIIEAHNGRIEIQSTLNKGTTVLVRFSRSRKSNYS